MFVVGTTLCCSRQASNCEQKNGFELRGNRYDIVVGKIQNIGYEPSCSIRACDIADVSRAMRTVNRA